MMTLAKPQTTMPIPICTSAKPWYWARRAPERPTRPFARASPATVIRPVSTPRARIICALFPVARIAVPRFVRKKT